eukprot:2581498-Rhodomonas_salina.1
MAPYATLGAGNVAERYKAFRDATAVECFHMRGTVSYESEDFTIVRAAARGAQHRALLPVRGVRHCVLRVLLRLVLADVVLWDARGRPVRILAQVQPAEPARVLQPPEGAAQVVAVEPRARARCVHGHSAQCGRAERAPRRAAAHGAQRA